MRQDTRFPDEPRTSFAITRAPASAWTLRLRIPSWTSAAVVKVNGRILEATPGAGSYLSIARVWKKGDRVDLELPHEPVGRAVRGRSARAGFSLWPIVLAGDLGSQGLTEDLILDQQGPAAGKIPFSAPELHTRGKKLEDWIKRNDSSP